jgi:hypothetical protein
MEYMQFMNLFKVAYSRTRTHVSSTWVRDTQHKVPRTRVYGKYAISTRVRDIEKEVIL